MENKELVQETKQPEPAKKPEPKKKRWFTTIDLLTIAVIGAVGAIASAYVINPVNKTLALGSPFLSVWVGNLHLFAVVIATQLVKRPGACMLTSILNGVCQLLFGNPNGVVCMMYAVGNGLGGEVLSNVFKQKVTMLNTMLIAGASTATGFAVDLILWYGKTFTFWGKVLYIVDAFAAGFVVCGLLSWAVLKGLEKAGITKLSVTP